MEGEDIWHVFNPRMLASKRMAEGRELGKGYILAVLERPQNYQYIALCEVEVGEDVGRERICVCERLYLVYPMGGL